MRLKHLCTYAAIAPVIAAPLALVTPASATTGGTSAFGVAADGPVPIPRTPAMPSTTGPQDKSRAELPPNPLVSLKALHVSTTPSTARASVTDLRIAQAGLFADAITAKCAGGAGSSTLTNVYLAGKQITAGTTPNSTISVRVPALGTASVTVNKQVRNPDGGVTVTALELSLPLAPGRTETVSISSVTCAGGMVHAPGGPGSPGGPTATPTPSPTSSTPSGEAPKPTPVPSNLPVTG